MNQKSNKKIIFPGNTSEIISELLDRYKINEDDDQFLKKMKEEEETNGRKIVNLLRKIVYKEVSRKDLPFKLAEKIDLSAEESISLAKDIEKNILLPMENVSPKNIPGIKKDIIKKSKDAYRETIK